MECQLCLKQFSHYKEIKKNYLVCKTKSCKNIKLMGESEHEKVCYLIHSGSSYINCQVYLKINISMLLFVPDLFKNSMDSITVAIYRSFSNYHKQFESINAFRNCVDLYRSKLAFSMKKEDYIFKNYFDNMILRLGISKNFQMSYTSSFSCSYCKFSFNKSISGNYIMESLLLLSCPTFSEGQLVYEIKCGKCSNNGVITFNFENKSKFLVLFLKEGFIHSEDIISDMEICLKNNFVILETDEPLNRKFSLWIKSDNLWYYQNNISDKILKSNIIPVINSKNVRVMFYEFDENLSLVDRSMENSVMDSECSNDNIVKQYIKEPVNRKSGLFSNQVDLDEMIETKKKKLNKI